MSGGLTPWMRCGYCGKIVRVNKPLFGSLHACISDEERAMIDQRAYQQAAQQAMAQRAAKRRQVR